MKRTNFITSLFFLAIAIFLITIIYPKFLKTKHSDEDDISLFLSNVMIRENGIYTLLGSKPITTFNIETSSSPQSTEELFSEYTTLVTDNPSFKSRLSFADYQKSIHHAMKAKHLRHKELWLSWMEAYGGKQNKKFLFTSRKAPYGDVNEGVFINIPTAIYILSKHQELFQKRTCILFDPHTILEEISSEHSEFWGKVFKDHFLMGILLGYGEKNAFIWELESKSNKSLRCKPANLTIDDSYYSKLIAKENVAISDLLIPLFVSYSQYDREVEKYQQEREWIIRFISNDSFIPQIIKLLGYDTN